MINLAFVIDDSTIDRTLSTMVLQKKKFAEKIVSFSAALEALQYLEENEGNKELLPQVIFLDVQMPEIGGFDFLDRYLETNKNREHFPVVYIVSSTTVESDRNRVVNYPLVKRFIPKPLTLEIIDELMEENQ